MKFTYILSAAILFLSSCVSTNFRSRSSDYQDINKGRIQQMPKIAEYEIGLTKVKGTYKGVYQTGLGSPQQTAKDEALAIAIADAKCDFLVHPLYDILINGSTIEVTVEGYPARYTSFKSQY